MATVDSRESVSIRAAEPEDLDTLVAFTRQEAREAENRELDPDVVKRGVVVGLQAEGPSRYWVMCNQDGTPVGSISVTLEWSDWRAANFWWIQSCFIQPEYRGQGLLDVMFDAVYKTMKQEQGLELRLYVHKGNPAAIRAYEKLGFEFLDYGVMERRV